MTPITLVGNNLGERHRFLNSRVNEAYRSKDFTSLEDIAEQSPVDRIFKINLASKLRNSDYIMKNLQDDDMLYVSKALKCKWLMEPEFQHILNPEYLETCLYPTMITPAVTKMKHWLYINLKNPERCQVFFLYYCCINFKLAVKFLRNCSTEFIKQQFFKHMNKISPEDFKIFCEKDPLVANIFLDAVVNNEEIKELYLSKEQQYFTALKSLLKSNTTMVLDVTETYFNTRKCKPFSSRATKFILKHYKTRFSQKTELYTAFLLNLKTLASCLSPRDAIDLTLTLARDKYLMSQKWFQYKKVEPIIKRINHEDRAAIKKKVFADKDVGTMIEKWPYVIPSSPVRTKKLKPIFIDREENPDKMRTRTSDVHPMPCARLVAQPIPAKTLLDKLFDEYRVASFDKVLYELRKKLKAESSAQNRQYMMLVLVSKSGGREKHMASLMKILSHYKNEPPQIRSAIVRSLVNRAQVWRVHDDTWKKFLEFSHGLGLDGTRPEAECVEGVHAVVIRQLLDKTRDPDTLSLYLKHFSNLDQYSLSNNEKKTMSDVIPNILFNEVCKATDVWHAIVMINTLLDTLTAFNLSIEKYPGLISKIASLSTTHILHFSAILIKLYRSRIARKELFKVNLETIKTEASYLNALRHDIDVISAHKVVRNILGKTKPKLFNQRNKRNYRNQPKKIVYRNQPNKILYWKQPNKILHRNQPNNIVLRNQCNKAYEKFFCKISIYFNEKEGLAQQFLEVLKSEDREKILNFSVKPLSILLGDNFMSYVKNVDNSIIDVKDKIFAAALRANAHLARPAFSIDIFGWSVIGTKAIANKVLVCRNTDIDNYVRKLLVNKRTVKLACVLGKRNGNYLHGLDILSKTKPTVALKLGFKILIRIRKTEKTYGHNESVVLSIWDIIKPLIESFDTEKMKNSEYRFKFPDVCSMPIQIRSAYITILYKTYRKESFLKGRLKPLLCYIEYFLPIISEEFVENVIADFFNDDMNETLFPTNSIYIRIIIKYMLLCKTEESQHKRFESIGVEFFDKMTNCFHSDKHKKNRLRYLREIRTTFRYYKVFLNVEYVSSIPVMEQALIWMTRIFPIEKKINNYFHMRINMIYYKAIRESIDKLPNRCIDDNNQMEARKMIGYTFGNYLAQEMSILKTTYFESIQYMCIPEVLSLVVQFSQCCEVFTGCLINGVLDYSADNVLAICLFRDRRHLLGKPIQDDILHRLRECENVEKQMVFFAATFSGVHFRR